MLTEITITLQTAILLVVTVIIGFYACDFCHGFYEAIDNSEGRGFFVACVGTVCLFFIMLILLIKYWG